MCWFKSKFPKKVNLANLKSDVDKLDVDEMKNVPTKLSNLKSKLDKLDVDKLVPVSFDLSKPSDVVKNNVIKKDVHNANTWNIEDKISDITNLATNPILIAKLDAVKEEILDITDLAANNTLNAKISKF